MNGEKLETVNKFKYMGATLTIDGKSEKDIRIRLTTSNLSLVNPSRKRYGKAEASHYVPRYICVYTYTNL